MIRTLIAESVALTRVGLFALLGKEPDIKIVAELDRAEFVVPTASRLQPDVAVIDGDMAAHDEFAAIRALHDAVPACGSVILANSHSHSPCELRDAVAACAAGFVPKDSEPDKITETVRRVAVGRKALDPDLAFSTLNDAASPLTAREIDVLRLAAQGAPAREIIAGELFLSSVPSVTARLDTQEKDPSTPVAEIAGDADVPSPDTCNVASLAGCKVTRPGALARLPRGRLSDWDAVRVAIEIVCGKWVLSVVAELTEGPKRHNQLSRAVRLDHKQLGRVLRDLLEAQIVAKEIDVRGQHPLVRYHLTQTGKDLLPALAALGSWSKERARGDGRTLWRPT